MFGKRLPVKRIRDRIAALKRMLDWFDDYLSKVPGYKKKVELNPSENKELYGRVYELEKELEYMQKYMKDLFKRKK